MDYSCKNIILSPNENGQGVRESVVGSNGKSGSLILHILFTSLVGLLTSVPEVLAADINGDGNADLLWRNVGTGEVQVWFLKGATVQGKATFGQVSLDWQIVGVEDFNGDGRADILWQHSTEGWLALWYMGPDGLTAMSYSLLSIPQMTDPNWVIVGAGDINGDNVADIVWQSQSNGLLAAWLMSGSQVFSWSLLSTYTPDLNWKVMGVGDVEGNGLADLIWHNVATGQVAVWSLNGYTVLNMYLIYNGSSPAIADPAWRLVGPG